jgi:NAD(P)H-dependent FMN reductase
MDKPRIGVIISTTRDGRFGDVPARWLLDRAAGRGDLDLELVDLRGYPLPFYGDRAAGLDDLVGADVAERWKATLAALDGYVFVTAEYNHSISGVLKNALDHTDGELARKPAAFVGYGGVGGARAVEQLRLIAVELGLAPLQKAVHIGLEPYRAVTRDGRSLGDFAYLNRNADALLDELSWWARALKAARAGSTFAAA